MVLKVGTDCSGIEAPIEALKQLKIPFEHVFSSEIDKFCIQSIKANYNPKIIFGDKDGPFPKGDIRKRNIKDVPNIDLYVCGFPCQPFSIAGERKGLNDERGNVFFSCLEVIKVKQPKYFILENVKGLFSHDKGKTWKVIESELLCLKEYGYNVKWKILNTKDYGIPQNRERIFIVGCKDKIFEFPDKIPMDKIENYVDWNDNKIHSIPEYIIKSKLLENIPKDSIFINFGFTKAKFLNSNKICPTILASNKLWNVKKQRFANIKECLKLQGFSENFIQKVSETQLKKQIGNSINVNVLKEIIKNLLY